MPEPDERTVEEIHRPIDAVLHRADDRWELVMRRRFAHSPERLWRMLTEPAELARWSPVVPDRPLTSPGPATCRENAGDEPVDAEVLLADEPRELVHRWGGDVLRWIVEPTEEGGVVLELRQRFDDRGFAPMLAAGWQVCLGRLAAEDGSERERPAGSRAMAYGWEELRDRYEAELSRGDS